MQQKGQELCDEKRQYGKSSPANLFQTVSGYFKVTLSFLVFTGFLISEMRRNTSRNWMNLTGAWEETELMVSEWGNTPVPISSFQFLPSQSTRFLLLGSLKVSSQLASSLNDKRFPPRSENFPKACPYMFSLHASQPLLCSSIFKEQVMDHGIKS